MRDQPVLQTALCGTIALPLSLVVSWLGSDGWTSTAALHAAIFAAAATALFYSLRLAYPLIVAVAGLIALGTSPRVLAAVADSHSEAVLQSSVVLIALASAAVLCRHSMAGKLIWLIALAGALVRCGVVAPTLSTLLLAPEWHLFFLLLGILGAVRRRELDPFGLWLVVPTLLGSLCMQPFAQQTLWAPVIGLGVGRIMHRGTLTRAYRIPPPSYALVLITIALVRSAVIVVTWAPQWSEYHNRIGHLLRPSAPQSGSPAKEVSPSAQVPQRSG